MASTTTRPTSRLGRSPEAPDRDSPRTTGGNVVSRRRRVTRLSSDDLAALLAAVNVDMPMPRRRASPQTPQDSFIARAESLLGRDLRQLEISAALEAFDTGMSASDFSLTLQTEARSNG